MGYNVYDIDFKKLVRWWTPLPMRRPFWLTLLGVLLFPLAVLHQVFLLFKNAKLYQLSITPQVCYLTKLLNDRYDVRRRRIFITNGSEKLPLFIYRSDELKPVFIYTAAELLPKFIYTSGETGIYRDDFIVFVPNTISLNLNELKGLVNAYKLAGVKFKVQFFGR